MNEQPKVKKALPRAVPQKYTTKEARAPRERRAVGAALHRFGLLGGRPHLAPRLRLLVKVALLAVASQREGFKPSVEVHKDRAM